MKAIMYTQYGPPDVLQLKETEKPVPKDNEVLIKVHAASLNALDGHRVRKSLLIRFTGTGFLKPKDQRLGVDVAGRVESVGGNVTQFQPGNEVFGSIEGAGAFAEYTCAAEEKVAFKPANVSFEAAAAVPVAALTALQGLRDAGQIQSGQKVLIDGASGGVGTFAVQIANVYGAEVTAVCGTRNLELVRSIGAKHVIDYRQEDFTRNGQRYDLILAVNGYHPLFAYRRALSPTGRYIFVGGPKNRLIWALLRIALLGPVISKTGEQKMGFMGVARINQKDLVYMKELLEAGKVVPVVDKWYSLGETAEALRYMEEEHARGKVVITVE